MSTLSTFMREFFVWFAALILAVATIYASAHLASWMAAVGARWERHAGLHQPTALSRWIFRTLPTGRATDYQGPFIERELYVWREVPTFFPTTYALPRIESEWWGQAPALTRASTVVTAAAAIVAAAVLTAGGLGAAPPAGPWRLALAASAAALAAALCYGAAPIVWSVWAGVADIANTSFPPNAPHPATGEMTIRSHDGSDPDFVGDSVTTGVFSMWCIVAGAALAWLTCAAWIVLPHALWAWLAEAFTAPRIPRLLLGSAWTLLLLALPLMPQILGWIGRLLPPGAFFRWVPS